MGLFEHTLEGDEGVSHIDVWEKSVPSRGNNRGKGEESSVAGAGSEKSRIVEEVRAVTGTSNSICFRTVPLPVSGLGRQASHSTSFSFQLHRSASQSV